MSPTSAAPARPQPYTRDAFQHILPIATRWMDNDVYGHVNNVIYYSYFDTVVNEYLISQGTLDIANGKVIGLVVETGCSYFASIAFPETIDAGLRVTRIGNSSVRYEVALFRQGGEVAVAQGHFVHVYVDRKTLKPQALGEVLKVALQRILG
ncbi:MAG: acyl-CoA thioesterase [Burkholderiales bacterium]|nr:acyl-CoA thioesterase [Burkholderiales bacterium]